MYLELKKEKLIKDKNEVLLFTKMLGNVLKTHKKFDEALQITKLEW